MRIVDLSTTKITIPDFAKDPKNSDGGKRGWPRSAESYYRKALLSSDPAAPGPKAEYLRFLKDLSRHQKERKEDLGWTEAAMKAVLKKNPRLVFVRSFLAEFLAARGRLGEAQRHAVLALRLGREVLESFLAEALILIIDGGRYSPEFERALLGQVRRERRGARSSQAESLRGDWPRIFSALVCARRYPAAFRLGEELLEGPRWSATGQGMLWPWWPKNLDRDAKRRFSRSERSKLDASARRGGHAHWFAYLRALLSNGAWEADQRRSIQVENDYQLIKKMDWKRYSWMYFPFIMWQFEKDPCDFDEIIRMCRAVLGCEPENWTVRCRMAEALLAKGARTRGLREFVRAEQVADSASKRAVLTWHGEALLWVGEYDKAIEKLDQSVALGARWFVYGWRGAARLKRGELQAALKDLDLAVEHDPMDYEARIWRGEAYRLLGRWEESLQDLDHVIASGFSNLWVYFNRALVRDAMGDAAGFAADYREVARIAWDKVFFISEKLGHAAARELPTAAMRRLMTAGLEMGKGNRRSDRYLNPIWMASGRIRSKTGA